MKTEKVNKIKLNVNYVRFLEKVKSEKILTMDFGRVRSEYIKGVKVKSALNIGRVNSRVFREELKTLVEKTTKIPYGELKTIGEKLVEKVRNKTQSLVTVE